MPAGCLCSKPLNLGDVGMHDSGAGLGEIGTERPDRDAANTDWPTAFRGRRVAAGEMA